MTEKLFWTDPYRTTLDTQITRVRGGDVWVARTIFFAFSGGQESDTGSLGGYPVLQALKDGLDISYTLPADHALQPGDAVTQRIDWDRRYALMRLHFAAELVLELVYHLLPGIEKLGAHIAPEKARIDFAWERSLTEYFPVLTTQARALVAANHPITSAFSDVTTERRYWEIAGFARVPCGGTHLKTTGEVGDISLKRKNPGQGKERIEIFVP